MLDDRDRKILACLQEGAEPPVGDLALKVNLSASACSRRILRLREEGYIARHVALLDRHRMRLPTTVFVIVKTSQHSPAWLEGFHAAVTAIPEIVEVHRLAGNFDYILKIVLPDVEHYDTIYKRLVQKVPLAEVSGYISMETVKSSTGVPTGYA